MKRASLIFTIFAAIVAGTLISLALILKFQSHRQANAMNKIHTLSAPMLFGNQSNSGYYMIPAGTTLYFDEAMDEGFSRYRVYLNVFGKPLPLKENYPEGAIRPAELHPINKADLVAIIKDIPLEKEDVLSIIENGNFSDIEKKDVMNQFSRKAKY